MVYCALLGFLISVLVIPLLLLPGLFRSIHAGRGRPQEGPEPMTASEGRSHAVPRLGGLALSSAFLAVVVMVCLLRPTAVNGEHRESLHLVWGALAIGLIGVWDDYRRLGTTRKLLLQAVVAAGVFSQGIAVETFRIPLASPFCTEALWNGAITVLWLVSLTSLVHIMDRVTGLAGAVGLAIMALLAIAGYWASVEFPALCAAGMLGALAAFLLYSLPPARIRLGGGGSCLIGFLIASLTVQAASEGTALASSLTPFVVVTLLILGAGFAVLRRSLGSNTPLFPPEPKPATQPAAPFPQRGIKPHA